MSAQHTPGPWRVVQHGRTFFVVRNRNDPAGNREYIKRGRGTRHFKTEVEALAAISAAMTQGKPCIGNDKRCPCNDGDACNYVATKTTAAFSTKASS